MTTIVATSVALRPTRSPKWPNRNDADRPRQEGDAEGQEGVERLGLRRRLGKNVWPITSAAAVP